MTEAETKQPEEQKPAEPVEEPQPVTKKTPDAASGPGRLLPRDTEEGVIR